MGGRYGGDPRQHRRGKQPTWRIGIQVLAAIGHEIRPTPRKPKPKPCTCKLWSCNLHYPEETPT